MRLLSSVQDVYVNIIMYKHDILCLLCREALAPGNLAQQYNDHKGKALLNSFITMKPKVL